MNNFVTPCTQALPDEFFSDPAPAMVMFQARTNRKGLPAVMQDSALMLQPTH